ncbi:hypothetical protein ABI59_09930 [Acidobacteria bacterium Mor1]|nr:hypothetical protein ABI59_09930 [Acidobacteria bacterium Mor1]
MIGQTFSVYFANFVPFNLICGVVLAPALILETMAILRENETIGGGDLYSAVASLLQIFLAPLVQASLTYGVFQHIRNKEVTIGDCLGNGLKRMFPVLGVVILVGLATTVGFILCIIPGILASVILACAVPAAVIERPGVFGALTRSQELTDGHRWTVFGVIFGVGIINIVLVFSLGLIAGLMSLVWGMIIATIFGVIVGTALQATAPTLIYYHLRKAKESIDVEEIAAVFD